MAKSPITRISVVTVMPTLISRRRSLSSGRRAWSSTNFPAAAYIDSAVRIRLTPVAERSVRVLMSVRASVATTRYSTRTRSYLRRSRESGWFMRVLGFRGAASVAEVAAAGEDHRHAVFVGGGDDFGVAH